MKFHLVAKKCFLSLTKFTPIARTSKMNLKLLLYLIVSFLYLFDIIMALPDVNIDENISMAQCRAVCLQKFTSQFSSSREDECNKKTDCDMCWNSCRMFQGNIPAKSTLCRDPTACFPGCQAACQFYEDSASKNLTPPFVHHGASLVAYMAPPKLLKEGQLVWEPPLWSRGNPSPGTNDIVIYIVMTKVNGIWNQHTQTAATKSILPKSVTQSEVRVFAVTPSGLVAYAEPADDKATKRSSYDGAVRDLESQGVTEKTPTLAKNGDENARVEISNEANYFDSNDVPYSDYNGVPDQEPPSVPIDHSWEISLDLLSMDLLASVEVSWEFRGSESVDYLVSWTESSGGISGHMVTKQDRVEISLWSGQHYSIQVELLDQHGNSVLRSMPKTISFGSPEPSVSATAKLAPKRNLTSTVRSTTTTTTTMFTFSTLGYPPIIRRKDYNPDFSVGKENRDAILRDSQRHLIPERTSTSTASYSEIPPWKNEASYNHVSLSNTRKDAALPQTPESGSSSQLMTWAACLGVGAVVILILIIWAVRTLRKSTAARQENRRAEDYLSETTASSVNSSNITTCSHLSRGSRVGRDSEDPPWTYETFYRVNNTPLTIQALHRPPPPIRSPPSPPIQHVRSVVPIQGSMGIPFSPHAHQFPLNSVQHINQFPLNTHLSPMPLSQISLGTHMNQITPSSSGVTHAIAVSTPLSVNASLVNNLSNRNCCGNL